ncbi:MAG: sugar nucleotide-binding protein [Acidimicrobiia bacterium]|nr:sugar nucleotide-binding protein [Acidimicrobiia bacterium]
MNGHRVLVIGAGGFLGANVALTAASAGERLVLHSRHGDAAVEGAELVAGDLHASGTAADLVRSVGAEVVLNCAALADVDRCEHEPSLAARLNEDVPAELAEACAAGGSRLVHISTDAVFGAAPGPYTTGSAPSPINVYGRTKAAGEAAVVEAAPDALVIRTNLVGWSPTGRRSLLEFFWRNVTEGHTVNGFTDVRFRPVAASLVWRVVAGWLTTDTGEGPIRHLTGAELLSKYDFGRRVATVFDADPDLVRRSTVAEAGLTAARTPDLDVRPSALPDDVDPSILDVDAALEHLSAVAASGYRRRVAAVRP